MNRLQITCLAFIAAVLLPLSELHADSPYKVGAIEIDQPWARATPPTARAGAAYFTVHNTGSNDDRLVSVSSPVASMAGVHQMTMNGDMMKMSEVKGGLTIPAAGTVTLAPSGYHVMLIGMKHGLMQGSIIPLTLTFANAGSINIEVQVEAIGAPGPAGIKPAPARNGTTIDGMKM